MVFVFFRLVRGLGHRLRTGQQTRGKYETDGGNDNLRAGSQLGTASHTRALTRALQWLYDNTFRAKISVQGLQKVSGRT